MAHAALFGVVTGMAGVGLLREKANDTTAALGAGNVALYALCYTPMKRVHWLNTWAGAVVGAVPPLMGWAAAREGAIEPASGVLAAALYFWQMPHFMALAYMAKDDYVRGGYRCSRTRRAIRRAEGSPGWRCETPSTCSPWAPSPWDAA